MMFIKQIIELKRENNRLRKALKRAVIESEGWIDEARGCVPSDIIGYDGWHDECKKLLEKGDKLISK